MDEKLSEKIKELLEARDEMIAKFEQRNPTPQLRVLRLIGDLECIHNKLLKEQNQDAV